MKIYILFNISGEYDLFEKNIEGVFFLDLNAEEEMKKLISMKKRSCWGDLFTYKIEEFFIQNSQGCELHINKKFKKNKGEV